MLGIYFKRYHKVKESYLWNEECVAFKLRPEAGAVATQTKCWEREHFK